MKIFNLILTVLFTYSFVNAQEGQKVNLSGLNFHMQSGIYLYDEELLCITKECEEIYKPILSIQNGRLTNTHFEASFGDTTDLSKIETAIDSKIDLIGKINAKSSLYKYEDEYGDEYYLFSFNEGENITWISFWKGFKGEYYLYESWSNHCLKQNEFLDIISIFLESQQVRFVKSKCVDLEEAKEEKYQDFIKKSMGRN